MSLLPIVLLMLVWELLARSGVLDIHSFPPMSDILLALVRPGTLPNLGGHILASLIRMIEGILLALVIGVPLGLAMGRLRAVNAALGMLVELLRPMPAVAIIPVLILLVGIGDSMKVLAVAFATLWPILVNTVAGARAVEPLYVQTARVMGYSNLSIMRRVILPAAFPQIMTGLRVGVSIALVLTIVSEMVASNNGLGYLVLNAERVLDMPLMYLGVIVIGLVSYLLNRIIFLAIERTVPWYRLQVRRESI